MGFDAFGVERRRLRFFAPHVGGYAGAGYRRVGFNQRRIFAVYVVCFQSFYALVFAPAEGRDLNPLLQDPGLIIHPPVLYMGYVGFSVAFAFAVAALLSGRMDAAWQDGRDRGL